MCINVTWLVPVTPSKGALKEPDGYKISFIFLNCFILDFFVEYKIKIYFHSYNIIVTFFIQQDSFSGNELINIKKKQQLNGPKNIVKKKK